MSNTPKISWHDATKFSRKNTGKEKTKCPHCNHQRTDKSDRSMSIDHNKGAAKCHYPGCGVVAFRDDTGHREAPQEPNYKIPPQDTGTSLNAAWIAYIESRKIYPETAHALGWTMERGNLCYNFFEGDTIVNKKMRTMEKKFIQSTGGKPIFYNIGAAETTTWIVEGEMDVAALYEIGIKNVISMPSANVSDKHWENSLPHLKHVEKWVLAVDNDDAGTALRDELARRLGKHRCAWVKFHGKDANDDLISGHLKESVAQLERFKIDHVESLHDHRDAFFDLYLKGMPPTITPKADTFGDFREHFSVLPGQLTVVTGIPSHGKSEFTDWLALNICRDHKMRGVWFSPEHGPTIMYGTKFAQKITGRAFFATDNPGARMSAEQAVLVTDWMQPYVLFRTIADGWTNWKQLIQSFDECVTAYDAKIFVVDAYNKVSAENYNDSELKQIRMALTNISNFAKRTDSMVFLVAHPRKMDKISDNEYRVPTMYDISGSADFKNIADNGYIVYRDADDVATVTIEKLKFDYQGRMRKQIDFTFNPLNGRYTTGREDFKDWLKDLEKPTIEFEHSGENIKGQWINKTTT